MAVKMLLVEDDRRVASFVARGLEAEGYAVELARDGREALAMARSNPYDLMILDRMIPHIDGLQVCRTLREEGCESRILMLTAKDGLQDKIDGLTGGADDYLTKPFAFDEFLARITALIRRSRQETGATGAQAPMLSVGNLRLDVGGKRAWRGDREIPLTGREYALLVYLMENAETVVSRSRLLSDVWNLGFDPGSKLVDVYIRYLRRKVDPDGAPPMIRTVRGFGYMIAAASEEADLPGNGPSEKPTDGER